MQVKLSKKRFAYITIIIILVGILFLWIKNCFKTVDVTYRYEEVQKGDVVKTIAVTGRLEIEDPYYVMSKIGGQVKSVYVDYNSQVREGQLLAEIDSTDIDLKIYRVGLQYERAKLEFEEIKSNMESKNELLKENLISKKEYEIAEITYKKALTNFKNTKLEYDLALKEKSYTQIYAPISGTIISREVNPREIHGPGKVFFVIAKNLKKMRLLINIDESEIGNVKPNLPVTFTVSAYPDRVFTGIISQVRFNPIPQGAVITYQSLVYCNNEELLLKPGMTATAIVRVGEKKNVIRVPNQAFIVSPVKTISEEGKRIVWKKRKVAIGDLPVEKVEVITGLVGDLYTEIAGGNIAVGDQVLVNIEKKLARKDDMTSYGK
ncbi:MAG: efflux RND transporter periplasmic adaptor subunit [Spirochaetes bacterium]|nr:efflux RND transporter periplasmic adaptor subunit [Spirochaetota bacterium]